MATKGSLVRTYLFASSDKKRTYHTTIHDNGVIQCDCPAFRECWHMKRVRDSEPIGRTEWTKIDPLDKLFIMHLLVEGNDAGAREYALELFPSMCVEETDELIREIQDHDESF